MTFSLSRLSSTIAYSLDHVNSFYLPLCYYCVRVFLFVQAFPQSSRVRQSRPWIICSFICLSFAIFWQVACPIPNHWTIMWHLLIAGKTDILTVNL